MDQKKVESCKSKLKTLDSAGRYSCIYQWVLTKNIKFDEFVSLMEYLKTFSDPEPEPEPEVPVTNLGQMAESKLVTLSMTRPH